MILRLPFFRLFSFNFTRSFCSSSDPINESAMKTTSGNYKEERMAKWNRVNDRGVSREFLYPPFQTTPSHTIPEFRSQFVDRIQPGEGLEERVTVCGRIMSKRHASKKLLFLDLSSNNQNLQIMASKASYQPSSEKMLSFNHLIETTGRGDLICVTGTPWKTKTGELSIIPREIQLVAPCMHNIPAYHGLKDLETRYRKRYLDLMINKSVQERFVVRSKIINMIRNSLVNDGYIEVETPTLWSDAGGANATPFLTHLKALDQSMPLFLRIAPELFLKMLVIGGMERVFELGKQFRNEGIDTTHNPEFTTCEFYRAYADYNHMMSFVENLLSKMALEICGSTQITLPNGQIADFSTPFRRIDIMLTLEEKIQQPLPDPNSDDSSAWEDLCDSLGVVCGEPKTTARLIDKLIGHFIEPECVSPTYLINHPQSLSPLAKQHRCESKKGLTERCELFIGGLEIVNAYSELNDPVIQTERFTAQALAKAKGDNEAQVANLDFVEALEHGLPPTAGCGIGVDRLVMLFSSQTQIREVILFPLLKKNQEKE